MLEKLTILMIFFSSQQIPSILLFHSLWVVLRLLNTKGEQSLFQQTQPEPESSFHEWTTFLKKKVIIIL